MNKFTGFMILVLAAFGYTQAGIQMGTINDWDPDPADGAWVSGYGWTTIDTPDSGGVGDSSWLRVDFAETFTGPDNTWWDIIRTPAENLYAGTWNQSISLKFDFWAADKIPNGLQVRWKSSTNDYIWGNAVTLPSSTGAWQTIESANLSNWDDWDIDGFATEEQFLADLSSIQWIGIYIQRNTAIHQVYGLDDVMLMVPEPCEWALLGAVAIAALVSHKRRLRFSLVRSDSA